MNDSFTGRSDGGFRRGVKSRSREVEPVNHSFVAHHVDLPALVGGEGGDALGRGADLADDLQSAVPLLQSPDAMRGVVATDVNAVEGRGFVAAIDVPARDRVTVFAALGEHRLHVGLSRFAVAIGERMK